MLPKLQLLVSLATAKSKATRQGNGAVQRVPSRRCHGRSRARPGPAAPLRSQRAAVTFRGCAPRSGLQEGAKTPAGAPAAALMLQRAARGSQLGGCPTLGTGTLPSPLLRPGEQPRSQLPAVCVPGQAGPSAAPRPLRAHRPLQEPSPCCLNPGCSLPSGPDQASNRTNGGVSPPGDNLSIPSESSVC